MSRSAEQSAGGRSGPGKGDSLDALEHEVGTMIRRIRVVMSERAQMVDPALSAPGMFLLKHLADEGPQRSSVVVEHFGIDKGAISRQVAQLCELGLARKVADPDDGRAQLIAVTEHGAQRLRSVSERRRALLVQRLDDWEDAELDDFVAMLARYNASLTRLVDAT